MHQQFLEAAVHLAAGAAGAGANEEGFNRRAASSAYYAVFHLLTYEAATRLAAGTAHQPEANRRYFARIFDHGLVEEVSKAISGYPVIPPTPIGLPAGHRVNRTLKQPLGQTSIPVALMWVGYAFVRTATRRSR